MQAAFTPKEETFVERTKKNIEDKISPLICDSLVSMFEENVGLYDVHYIEARVRGMLEDVYGQLDFNSKEVKKARLSLFRGLIQKAKGIKIKLKTDKDKLADARNKACEPVCQEIVKKLFDLELLESDKEFFNEGIAQDDEAITKNRIRGFVDGLFAGLQFSLNQSLMRANKKLWGTEKEDIKMKQVDVILKQK